MQQTIFEPLAMKNSGYNLSLPSVTGKAVGYIFGGDEPVVEGPLDYSNGFSAFGLYSSAEDLYRWDRALYTDQLVGEGGLKDLFATYTDFGRFAKITYGWIKVPLHERNTMSFGFGPIPPPSGFKSSITRLPDDDIVIIVLSNMRYSPVIRMRSDLAAILLGVRYRSPAPRTEIEIDPEKLDDFVGDYADESLSFGSLAGVTVTREGDSLFFRIEDFPRFQIFPESRATFFARVADIEIRFRKTDFAGVTGLVLRVDGGIFIPDAEIRLRKVGPGP